MNKYAATLMLFILSPLIGEYLLGNVSLLQWQFFPFLALLYGAGSVFIRELTRQTGRGWPTLLLLALAYAVAEESFATQSLFNPNFAGQDLLAYGYMPALGMGGWWTVYVLSIHVIWSIAVPIALIEALCSPREAEPWLGKTGLAISCLIFVAGLLLIAWFSLASDPFRASTKQLICSAIAVLIIAVAAFVPFPRRRAVTRPQSDARAPAAWMFGVLAFIAGSLFHVLNYYARSTLHWMPAATVGASLVLCGGVASITIWSARRSGWSAMHPFALAAGGVLAYCWYGFLLSTQQHRGGDIGARFVLVALVCLLLGLTGRRLSRGVRNLL